MSIGEYYEKRIASSETYIQEKQEENAQYAQQEEQKKGLLQQQIKRKNLLSARIKAVQRNLENFVRDNGGVFGLTDKQEREYSKLMDERSILRASLKDASSLRYNLAQNITSLSNRQYSNYMSIFNETLGIGELKNQQHLFSALSYDLD